MKNAIKDYIGSNPILASIILKLTNPWAIVNFILAFILSIMLFELNTLLEETSSLRKDVSDLRTELKIRDLQSEIVQSERDKINEKTYKVICVGAVIVIIIVIVSYFGGIDPGSIDDACNDLGNQFSSVSKSIRENNTANFVAVKESNDKLGYDLEKMDKKFSGMLAIISNQIARFKSP